MQRRRAIVAILACLLVFVSGCSDLFEVEDIAAGPPSSAAEMFGGARPEGVPDDAEPAVLDRVVDGDTIRVVAAPGSSIPETDSIRVRLLNIDAPELARDGQQEECLAVEATERLEELLADDEVVWLVADEEDRDPFDRPLRGVWTEAGAFVNEVLVAEGLAEAVLFPPNDRFHADMVAAEERATSAEVGIHGAACQR